MTQELIEELYKRRNTPLPVQRHCLAVARQADRLASLLEARGIPLCRERLWAAAMLHDVARAERHHAAVGAAWLSELGYPEISEAIACHHWLSETQTRQISEASVLYLADKLTSEDRAVSLEARFSGSLQKCLSEAGREMHRRRYAQARQVERLIMEAIEGKHPGRSRRERVHCETNF